MKKIFLKIIYIILSFFTRFYISRTKPYVIWITWSVWKTSCRMILFQILKKYLRDKEIYTSPKNFNSELGLIFSIFKIENYNPWFISLIKVTLKIIFNSIFFWKKYDLILLEYWVDHPNDMDFLLTIVKPNISIFTKLDSIHIENFSTKRQIWKEKFKLIKSTKEKTYLNYDDEFLREKISEIKIDIDFFNKWNLKFNYIKELNNIFSEIYFDNKIIKTNILWQENFTYIELAFSILNNFLINNLDKNLYLELKNQWWRFNIFSGLNNSLLIDSTYNAWFESIKVMIENTRKLKSEILLDFKLWFVIWDMRELWNFSEEEHKKLFNQFDDNDLLITVWKETKKYFPQNIKNFSSSKKAWLYLKGLLEKSKNKYLILFKWSQNTIFIEEALKEVLLNRLDEKKLVRQDKSWMKKKKLFL